MMGNIIKKLNKKTILLIFLITVIALVIIQLYGTFAFANNTIANYETANKVFNLNISNINNNIYNTTISKNDTKDLELVLLNKENINLNYAIYYSGVTNNSDIEIGVLSDSQDKSTGIISQNDNHIIELRITNNTNYDINIEIGVVYGYVNGGDLLVGEDEYIVDKTLSQENNLDQSGANKPNIVSGMIPVYYDEYSHNWKKADETNIDETTMWYNYQDKKWANIVLKNVNTVIDLSNNLNNATNKNASWNKEEGTITTNNDSYIDCGLNNYYLGNSFTMILKLNLNNLSTNQYLLGNWESEKGGGLQYSLVDGEYKINSNFYFSDNTDPITVIADAEVKANTWYNIAVTYDGTNTESDNYKIFLNGKLVGSSKATGALTVSNNSMTIGKNSTITVSDVLIFKRSLSDEDISNFYNDNIEVNDDTNLIMYYNFMDSIDIPNGTVISDSKEDGTLAFFTWIPRYKYKVWNIEKKSSQYSYTLDNGSEYNAYNKGIDIIFESNTNSTGKINCNYKINNTDTGIYIDDFTNNITLSEVCNGNNGEYYTHPAFNFANAKTGFWISKFEISGSLEEPNSLPDSISTTASIGESFDASFRITNNNLYGITNSNLTSHILKNSEWGAVAYLTHSIYGLCDGYSCEDVNLNNSESFYTGRSLGQVLNSGSVSSNKYGNYNYEGYQINEDTGDNNSNIKQSTISSTTKNVYGVYDLAGGRSEYVMGLSVDVNGSIPASTVNYLDNLDKYYYDLYSYGNDFNTNLAYNRSILGDATGELVLNEGIDNGLWYNQFNNFLNTSLEIFTRGGTATNIEKSGLFSFQAISSYETNNYGYRISLS